MLLDAHCDAMHHRLEADNVRGNLQSVPLVLGVVVKLGGMLRSPFKRVRNELARAGIRQTPHASPQFVAHRCEFLLGLPVVDLNPGIPSSLGQPFVE